MRAVFHDRYGDPQDVLRVVDVAKPTAEPDGVVAAVHTASLNSADWRLVTGRPLIMRAAFGLRSPKNCVPGSDFAGSVVEVGSDVTGISIGDEVFGCTSEVGQGTCAQFVHAPASHVAIRPTSVSAENAAAVPLAGLTALQAVRKAEVHEGDNVLIVGAAGGVGHFAVQLSVAAGATVTGVCSTPSIDTVSSFGAERLIDYTTTDYLDPDYLDEMQPFDTVIHIGGSRSARELRTALTKRGTLMIIGGDGGGSWFGPIGRYSRAMGQQAFVSQKIAMINSTVSRTDLDELGARLVDGSIQPHISDTTDLNGVPREMARLQTGGAVGKTLVRIAA